MPKHSEMRWMESHVVSPASLKDNLLQSITCKLQSSGTYYGKKAEVRRKGFQELTGSHLATLIRKNEIPFETNVADSDLFRFNKKLSSEQQILKCLSLLVDFSSKYFPKHQKLKHQKTKDMVMEKRERNIIQIT